MVAIWRLSFECTLIKWAILHSIFLQNKTYDQRTVQDCMQLFLLRSFHRLSSTFRFRIWSDCYNDVSGFWLPHRMSSSMLRKWTTTPIRRLSKQGCETIYHFVEFNISFNEKKIIKPAWKWVIFLYTSNYCILFVFVVNKIKAKNGKEFAGIKYFKLAVICSVL